MTAIRGDVGARCHRHVRREDEVVAARLADRLLAGQHAHAVDVPDHDLHGRVARLDARGLAGEHQLDALGIVGIGGEIAGDAQADGGRGDWRFERVREARRPVAIVVVARVEDLPGADGDAAARDLHLHAPPFRVAVSGVLLDADAIVAGQLAAETIEDRFGADLGAIRRAAGHAGERIERAGMQVAVVGGRRGDHPPAGRADGVGHVERVEASRVRRPPRWRAS